MNRKWMLISMSAVVLLVDVASAAEPEEVIVTARKREESILNVPLVISALPQQALEQAQIHDLYTLTTRVPGLVLGSNVGAVGAGVSIRGVGTTAVNATVDQSISLNVDGLQLSQGLAYQAGMFDVGQVEVMKGPQALFWGKNSPGGVISLRSADPTDQTEVELRGGYEFEANEKFGEMIVSGGVTDALKLRLAAHYSDSDGYFRNRDTVPEGYGLQNPPTDDYAGQETWIIRGTALFDVSDVYDARVKLNYTRDLIDNGGGTMQTASCPFGLTSFTGLPMFDPNEDCTLNRDTYIAYMDPQYWQGIRNNGVPYTDSVQEFGTLEQNLYFSDLRLNAVTGFYEVNQESMFNGSGNSGVSALVPDNDFFTRQFTQEVRVSSEFTDSPLNFMVGAFYQDARMTNDVNILGNTGIPGVPLPPVLQKVKHGIDIESFSVFGQLIWNITDRIELAGGARWTDEQRDHTQDNLGTPGVPLGPTPLVDPHLESDNVSPELSVTYRPTDDVTLFASYKQGYKSGSFNSVSYIDPTTPSSFGDEQVEGGEAGLKARLLDRRLELNLAAYYYHYSDLQVGSSEITPQGIIAIRTINAATANVKGIDLDASYSPDSLAGLTVRGAVNYNDGKFGSFPNAPCSNGQLISEGCDQLLGDDGAYHAQDLSGRPLVRAPEWTIMSGADYEMPVGERMTLAFGATVTYTSEYYNSLLLRPGWLQDDFTKVNANIALRGADEAWEVALIGNNVTDEITASNCLNAPLQGAVIFGGTIQGTDERGPGGDDYPFCLPERGREVWLRVKVRPAFLQ